MSQITGPTSGGVVPITVVETLTGNTGGAVGPTGNNINVVGDGTTITVAGNPGTSTLTISSLIDPTDFVQTLTGDTGGPISPVAGNIDVEANGGFNTSGITVAFVGTAGQLRLGMTDANGNTTLGGLAGNGSMTGIRNTGVGNAVFNALSTGNNNVALGYASLNGITTGSNNIVLGSGTFGGQNYSSSESSNILLSSAGTTAESNTIRIGTQGSGVGQQNRNFQAGISGVTVANAQPVYMDTTNGQMGTNPGAWTAFTPTVIGETTAGTTTYSLQSGRYIRIGNTVTAQFSISVSGATGTGNILISSLPISISASAVDPIGSVSVSGPTWPAGSTSITVFGNPGANTCRILCAGSATAAAFMQISNIPININCTVTYEV